MKEDKATKYVCICGNDENFEYLGRKSKKRIYKCEECGKIIRH